jgi:hypothetical protein
MRVIGMLVVLAALTGPGLADGAARGRRYTRCCLELAVPELPPGPICAQVRGRRGLRPRRACRLLGGRPIGAGNCSLAACRRDQPA